MNRRQLFSFLGIAPVAVATAAMATTSSTAALSAKDANLGNHVADVIAPRPPMLVVRDAYARNDIVSVSGGNEKRIRELVSPSDEIEVKDLAVKNRIMAWSSNRIEVLNHTRGTTFFVRRPDQPTTRPWRV